MRFTDIPVSITSIAATVGLAAALATVTMLPQAQDVPADFMPVVFEEMTVYADAAEQPAVVATLQAGRESFAAGQPVTVQARIENRGDVPVLLTSADAYDLTVLRTASPQPMGIGDVTFLTLAQAGGDGAVVLAPGESTTRDLRLGAEQPFDRPGTYRVTGSWIGADGASDVTPFEVVVEPAPVVAQKHASGSPGA